jgi:hypothetical protein
VIQRTYWHLEGRHRMPNDYEIASSRLHWWPQLGFSVATPVAAWQERHALGSPLRCDDWERFHDPAERTYASYIALARDREAFADGLFDSALDSGDARRLARAAPAWLETLARVLSPLRFPLHALQMVTAYLGSLAPSGRITLAAAFQAADEMRRLQHVAQRLRMLEEVAPGIARRGRESWQHDPAWQPLREAMERLLTTYDFGECFAALQLAIKPAFDEFFVRRLSALALEARDDVLARLLLSHEEACRWHAAWSEALVRTLIDSKRENEAVLQRWTGAWRPRAEAAIAALAPAFAAPAVTRSAP